MLLKQIFPVAEIENCVEIMKRFFAEGTEAAQCRVATERKAVLRVILLFCSIFLLVQ
jgi:hypothetical protein